MDRHNKSSVNGFVMLIVYKHVYVLYKLSMSLAFGLLLSRDLNNGT